MKKILIVDDESDIQIILADILNNHFDAEIKTVGSGLDALQACTGDKYDLIFSDEKMGVMRGSEFINKLRSSDSVNKDTHVIFISGFIEDISKDVRSLPEVSLLEKPFFEDDIVDLVKKIFR